MVASCRLQAPGRFAPGTIWIGHWVGPRVSLDAVVKRKISVLSPAGNWTPVV